MKYQPEFIEGKANLQRVVARIEPDDTAVVVIHHPRTHDLEIVKFSCCEVDTLAALLQASMSILSTLDEVVHAD